MSRGEIVHVIPLAIGCFVAVKAWPVPGGHAPFYIPDRIPRKTVDMMRG